MAQIKTASRFASAAGSPSQLKGKPRGGTQDKAGFQAERDRFIRYEHRDAEGDTAVFSNAHSEQFGDARLLDDWTMPANSPTQARRQSSVVWKAGREGLLFMLAATVCFVSSTFIIRIFRSPDRGLPYRDRFVTSDNTATMGSGLLTSGTGEFRTG